MCIDNFLHKCKYYIIFDIVNNLDNKVGGKVILYLPGSARFSVSTGDFLSPSAIATRSALTAISAWTAHFCYYYRKGLKSFIFVWSFEVVNLMMEKKINWRKTCEKGVYLYCFFYLIDRESIFLIFFCFGRFLVL